MSTIAAPRPRTRAVQVPRTCTPPNPARLGHYRDAANGTIREIVSVPGTEGSRLIIDRLAGTLTDARLVGHLAADEPAENASILCALYLADKRRRACRHLQAEDFELVPFTDLSAGQTALPAADSLVLDRDGIAYGIRRVDGDGSLPELRWTRSADPDYDHPLQVLHSRHHIVDVQLGVLADSTSFTSSA